ncbi:MAG TPA: HAMP domain-containing histidine kinase [Campylobacterales bacterium]|nr:HAMP domain-containing histidine kinase [Campylobacterales bacterium]
MHRLLKRQIKQVYGKNYDINDFDLKTLMLLEHITETYKNFDEEKSFLNQTVKENKQVIQDAYKNMLTTSRLAAIGEMMENITHQWKQPLSVILNLIQILKLDINERKELQIIEDQTRYLDKTISDFTNFSSHSNEEKSQFSLEKSIDETLDMFAYQAEINEIAITKKIEDEIFVKGDIGRFNQALLVILSNAKDAFVSREIKERQIEIKCMRVEGNVELHIEDNAGGINEEFIAKVFEPYFTTKFKDKGTGIGLSMTYNIIKKMNGTIEVYNNNEGALFKIKIARKNEKEVG